MTCERNVVWPLIASGFRMPARRVRVCGWLSRVGPQAVGHCLSVAAVAWVARGRRVCCSTVLPFYVRPHTEISATRGSVRRGLTEITTRVPTDASSMPISRWDTTHTSTPATNAVQTTRSLRGAAGGASTGSARASEPSTSSMPSTASSAAPTGSARAGRGLGVGLDAGRA